MSSQDNVVYLGAGGRSAAGRKVLAALREVMPSRLGRTLAATLDQVDDALFDRAQRAGNNADQEHFFVAMRQVRLNRRDIEQRFLAGLDTAFANVLGEGATTLIRNEDRGGELTLELMDEAAVEQDVAVDTAISRSRGRFSLALTQLSARIEESAGAGGGERNPLDPAQIVHAFSAATAGLEIDIQPRIILYKLFEKQLLAGLEPVYEEANRRFAEAGVLPGIRGGRTVSPRSSGASDRSLSANPGLPGGVDNAVPLPEGSEVYQLLQQLLAGARQDDSTPVGSAPSYPSADIASVVSVLSSLQHRGAGGRVDPQRLKTVIGRGLTRSGAAEGLGRSADDTIDIVSMLFEVILDDRRLSDAVRALIARLQIPVIKVALLDREFFGSRRHPARRLINELAQAAAGWSEPEEPKSDPLFRAMADIVERVVGRFTDDIGVFEEALADFQAFRQAEQERSRHIEERTRQTVEGKAKVDEARERVRLEIQARTAGDGVPGVARSLLEEAWFKVLFITAVKEGTESETWNRQVGIMDRLLKSVHLQPGLQARREMISNIPGLLRDIREGLNGIMFNPFEMTRLFRELEAEHLRCLSEPPSRLDHAAPPANEETPTESTTASDSAGAPVPGPTTEAPAEVEMSGEDAALAARLAGLDFGTWFELDDSSGQRVRGKLTARLNRGRRFIFVNRAGFKVGDRSLETLIEELKAGRSAILDDNELFDRALESVVANLREMRAARLE